MAGYGMATKMLARALGVWLQPKIPIRHARAHQAAGLVTSPRVCCARLFVAFGGKGKGQCVMARWRCLACTPLDWQGQAGNV